MKNNVRTSGSGVTLKNIMGFDLFSDFFFLAITFGFIGKTLLGITVINVHSHIVKEHRIDIEVLTEMRKERIYGLLGVFFIAAEYIFELAYYSYFPFL